MKNGAKTFSITTFSTTTLSKMRCLKGLIFSLALLAADFIKLFSVIIYTPNLSANLRQYDTSGINYAEKKF